MSISPVSLYIHIPFCEKHCAYCDFNTYVEPLQSAIVAQTTEAIRQDILATGTAAAREAGLTGKEKLPVHTLFFGGGTPTFLPAEQLILLISAVREAFELLPDAEISSEANPGSSDAEKFAQMRKAGVNRLSVGIQAFDDQLLEKLDRFHTVAEGEAALRAAGSAGFTNLSLDLMFGLPGQTMPLWEETLERALAMGTTHLSLYALTLEPGTRFERLRAGGKLELPGEDAELEMYERAITVLTEAGFEHYEVSNFALPGSECRHNLTYWHNEPYLGFGPGAVSYWQGERFKKRRLPLEYARQVHSGSDLREESEIVSPATALGETMMLGLRLQAGVEAARIERQHGIDIFQHFARQISMLTEASLLERTSTGIRLTHTGLLFANEAAAEFLPN